MGVIAPTVKPTAMPVIRRPINSPGKAFQTASRTAATIMVATAVSITPRRPIRLASAGTATSAAIVPAAKIA